jgi:hypothetical protein
MNKSILSLIAAAALLFAISALADIPLSEMERPGPSEDVGVNAYRSQRTKQNEASKGLRISVFASGLGFDVKSSVNGNSSNQSYRMANTGGASLSYVNLPIRTLGWTAGASYITSRFGGDSIDIARIEGNLGYAFNAYVYVRGGLNVSKLINSSYPDPDLTSIGAAPGFQTALGYQLTPIVGAEIGYAFMWQSGDANGANFSLTEYGLDAGLTATF